MPSITVSVDDDLKDRMEQHPEINWSEVTRQAIQEKTDSKTCDSEVVPAREFYPSIGAAEAAIGETDPDGLFTLRVRSPPTRPS